MSLEKEKSNPRLGSLVRPSILLIVCAIALALATAGGLAQKSRKVSGPTRKISGGSEKPGSGKNKTTSGSNKTTKALNRTTSGSNFQDPITGQTVGVPSAGERGIDRTTAEIMQTQQFAPPSKRPAVVPEHEIPGRRERPQDPNARPVPSLPDLDASALRAKGSAVRNVAGPLTPSAPQTISMNFDTVTGPTETGAFPPDTMGAIGPTQFFVFLNGRLRTFNKATGAADGVVNLDPDVFFSSVMTPAPPPLAINFTSDPQVRYDRLSGRWFLLIIDVPSANDIGDTPNRILLAVSDAASAGVISAGTVWTFYFVQQNTVGGGDSGGFCDYPSLGVDANALYTGCDEFDAALGGFNNTTAFVIRKTSVLSGGPVVTTAFRDLIGTDGPFEPRGVDNYDPAATEGYYIGASAAAFGRLIMRRVGTPGGTPTISANISITVPATSFPRSVDHLGDSGGTGATGNLDALDDRLMAAHIRAGRLWTSHSISVTSAGVGSGTDAQRRDAVRWYELIVPPTVGTPTVNQSGTIFDPAATVAAARQYFIPSVLVSGQGHAAFGYSTSGTPFRADAATNGRLVGDTLGTSGAVNIYTASSTAYNPPADPGSPRRWGDYSFTSLDPLDDMTMWTIQEYCNGTGTYGNRVAKLLAPAPPATATAAPAAVADETASTVVVLTGVSVAGTGYYDPGANLAPPALPFNHINATVTGGVTVTSITYNTPTQVTLDLSTIGATPGPQNVMITNPDGQSATYIAAITVTPAVAPPATAGQVIISEFRFRGAAGAADEYVELYNATNGDLDISGYTLHALTGAGAQALRFTVPGAIASNTTVIPARGHYLMTGTSYSLPVTSNGVLSTGTVDGSGLGFFAGATPTAGTRIDSAGFDTRDALFFEGTAIFPSGAGTGGITVNGEYAFLRKWSSGFPRDTDNNDSDFIFVSTNAGTYSTRISTLGAPGPENLAGPIHNATGTLNETNLDPAVPVGSGANFVRSFAAVTNGTNGTITIRRTFTNNTGSPLTSLRFRIIDLSTLNSVPTGPADLRALDSSNTVVAIVGPNPACPANSCSVLATTVETPPAQALGGGIDSSFAAGTITAGTPLANGASINLHFVFGVNTVGNFRFVLAAEGLPGVSKVVAMQGCVDTNPSSVTCNVPTAAPASISGNVVTADGAPLSGVTMRLAGAKSATAITDAAGAYHFDNVDTEQFYTITPNRANYHFNPGNRSFSLRANMSDAVFTAIPDAVTVGNAIDTPEYFVRQHYLDFLGREPDEAGFNFWTDQIASCGGNAACLERKRINVSAAYFLSIEFQRTGGLVDGLYRVSFGRAPKYAEFIPDTAAMAANVVVGKGDWEGHLRANQQAFVQSFVNRAGFRAAYDSLSNPAYVDALIAHTGVSFSGRDGLVSSLNSGSLSRGEVLLRIAENEEFVRVKRNAAFVMMEYFGYLRRDPDQSGYDFWLNKLNQFDGNFERAEMVKAFINSGEYRARFAR
ncbi:MAG TPA: DUF4214 domain-containing protein [Pyrinomonadaceae bacterium]|nr:DUF4214 domain-containing protein [Pyrinomonadaceae bacterium]